MEILLLLTGAWKSCHAQSCRSFWLYLSGHQDDAEHFSSFIYDSFLTVETLCFLVASMENEFGPLWGLGRKGSAPL